MVCGILKRSLCVALGVGWLFALTGGPALAYTVGGGSSASGPTGVPGGTAFTFSAKFIDGNGNPIVGTLVTFAQASGPTAALPAGAGPATAAARVTLMSVHFATQCQATFNPVTATTDSTGTATTQVTLPPGCPGQYVLLAVLSGGGSVSFTVVETGGFPNTSAAIPGHPALAVWQVAALLALVAAAAGLGLVRARARRSAGPAL